MVLLETTVTLGGRRHTSQYVDVYRLHDGKATEHWHLPLDQRAGESFFAG
jgi:predicted SnoaL-like aldol condensation-catalyzing enzyme